METSEMTTWGSPEEMKLSSDDGNKPEVWTHIMVTGQPTQGPLITKNLGTASPP